MEGLIKVIAFPADHAAVDKITDHLKLTFVEDKPPPPQAAFREYPLTSDSRPIIVREFFQEGRDQDDFRLIGRPEKGQDQPG